MVPGRLLGATDPAGEELAGVVCLQRLPQGFAQGLQTQEEDRG